jgi:phosphonatase-like hydrolase
MPKYLLVVFDMAGTTVKDKGNVAEAFVKAFEQNQLLIPVDEVNKVMGWRKKDAIVMLMDKHHTGVAVQTPELVEKIHDDFIRNMIAFYEADEELEPLPFAEDVFKTLRMNGVKVALNTGFTKAITDVLLKKLNWNEHVIDAVISSDEVKEGRPHPYMIQQLMYRFNLDDAMQVAKVGDTEVDVLEGRNSGCGLVVSITTGAYTREQLKQYEPDKIIDSLHELPSLIL